MLINRDFLSTGVQHVPGVFSADEVSELLDYIEPHISTWERIQPNNGTAYAGLADPSAAVIARAARKAAGVLAAHHFTDVRCALGVIVPKWYNEGRRPYHVDWWNWDNFTDTCRETPPQVGVLCYLHATTAHHTGALLYVPGSHRREVIGHYEYWETPKQHPNEEALPVNAGDAILLDARVLHAVDSNLNLPCRVALTFWFLPDYTTLSGRSKATVQGSVPAQYWQYLTDMVPEYSGTDVPQVHTKKPQFPITYERIEALTHGLTDAEILCQVRQPEDAWIDTDSTYTWYRAVGAAKVPAFILELGVRYGYSGVALLCGAAWSGRNETRYIGIDGEIDGIASNRIALNNLRPVSDDARVWSMNTRKTAAVCEALSGYGNPDLIHIDGDHSPDGILSEIAIAKMYISPAGIILIDDTDTPHVGTAARDLCDFYGIPPLMLPTKHQLMLIDMRKRTVFQ